MIWPFKRSKSLSRSGLLTGYTDCHCHILPGVDDGVQTMEDSLRVLAFYGQLGIRSVWLTPHIMEDIPNTTASLRQRFAELQEAYHGNVTLHLAAENMLDNLFEERLAAGDLLPLGPQGRHLLVETSYFNPPMGLDDILQRIKAKGFIPVLAHPERYIYMTRHDLQRLHEGLGILFQLNLPSLCGAYGPDVQETATRLLKAGLYDLSGTDLHRLPHWQAAVNRKLPTSLLSRLSDLHQPQ